MTSHTKLLIVIVSVYFGLLAFYAVPLLYATTTITPSSSAAPTTEEQQPKPGIIMIITFENGTTKAIRSDSTNIQAVNGGYFIADSSVKESQPLQSKTVSKTVVQQLVSVFVDVSIVDEPPTSSEGCGEGFGYYVDDPNPICEPLDKIGQGPPPDQAFCAALGCPYNPPADSDIPQENNNLATTPVTPPGPGELSAAECAAIGCNPGDPISEPVEARPPSEEEDENRSGDSDDGESNEPEGGGGGSGENDSGGDDGSEGGNEGGESD